MPPLHHSLLTTFHSVTMAEKYSSIGLFGVMDRLWFHQIILFSETPSVTFPENQCQTTLIPQEEFSSVESESSTLLQDVCEKEEASEKESTPAKERPTRLNTRATRNRSHSYSTSPYKKHSRNLSSERRILDKCKSLGELELEEVKGFMDLGFIFRKEHISKRMISVIPGLQRLEVVLMSEDEETNNEEEQPGTLSPKKGRTTKVYCTLPYATKQEDKREIVRPYLSEAWLIKKPDSPLLNMRVPRISAAADMKKHLRCWAKTVATVVLQES